MMVTRSVASMLLSGGVFLTGCAGVQPRESFPQVERTVAERSGYRVRWNDGSAADKAVDAEVEAMLAKPLDADAAVQIALLNNHRLQAIYEDLGVAQASLVEAGLLRNPVFDASVGFTSEGGSPSLDLGIAFEFLDVLFIGARRQLAEAQLEAAKANVTLAVLNKAGEVKVAFYALQAAEQTVELRQQVERATAASYDLARRLREAGNNTALDLAYERALHEEAKVALAAAQTDAATAREGLNREMGLWGQRANWTAAGRLPELPNGEAERPDLERQAIENSLELLASRATVTVAARELGIALPFGYLSELEVGAVGERDDGEWEVGPAIALPIPIFSQGQPAIARAQAEFRRAEQNYYATAVEIRSNVRAAYTRTQATRQQAAYYRNVIMPLRQTIVDETQLQYNAMQLGAFQLLQAKRDQIESARTYVSLLRDYWTAKTQLEIGLRGGSLRQSSNSISTAEPAPASAGGTGGH